MSRPQSQGKLGSPSGPVANAETEGSATGHQEHEMTSKAVGEHTPIMGSSERLTAAGPVSSGTGAQMAMSPDNVDGHAYESSLHAVTDPQPVEGRFPTHVNHQDFAYQAQVTPPSGHPESVEPHLSGGSTAQQSGLRWDIPDRTEEEKDQHGEGSSTDDEDEADVFAFQPPTTTMPNATASSSSPDQSSASTADMIEEAPATYTASRKYDMSHPPPYSGRNNMNNSVFPFAFGPDTQMRRRGPDSRPSRPDTGAATDASRNDLSTAATLDTEVTEEAPRSRQHRFLRPFSSRFGRPSTKESNSTYSTEPNWITEDSRPPRTARSTGGVTDMSGDATIPDGVTTWGDGVGGEFKDLGSDLESPEGDYVDEDSPYAEVRASVSNMDDPDMPALTLRAWVIGMLLTLIGSAANTFFYFRNPAPHIPLLVVQVVAYPIGRFAALVLPIREWTVPRWLGGWSFSLNPCPFNVKEHTIIVMMAQVAISAPYGLGTIVATELWYHRPLGVGFSFIYIIATQLTGLSMAGIARRFVVWPASMIWPGVLVLTTNLNTLHAASDGGTGGVSRLRFFTIATIAAFVYYFIPGFLFVGLSYFSYICWAAPKSKVVNQLFGVSLGLGMGVLTFDWNQIAWIGSPLANPWWAQVNVGIGFVLFYWIIVPILFYTNTWYTKYLPIMAMQAGDRFQKVYNVSAILTPEFTLNETAYSQYSQVYLPASFNMTYMVAFALTTSLVVYTILAHGKRIVRTLRRMQVEPDDIHMKLMKGYPEVPDWWYIVALSICVVLGIVTVEVFKTGLPVWGYLVALLVAWVYIIPSAIMVAMTNLKPAINTMAELIPGYAFQGQPLAGMIFKTFAVQSLVEAINFTRDMKLGHYMKIPPRSMFIAQLSAVGVACFVQVGLKEWLFRTIPDMCAYRQKDMLVCSTTRAMYSASIIWGLVGPERLFSKGGIYNPQLYMLLVGALAPIPFWLWVRKYPKSILRNINVTVIFCVCIFTPPATGINIASFLLVGFIFQYWIRRHHFAWWSKYNYALSAALDVGTLGSLIFIFLVLALPGAKLNWWGNTVFKNTLDWVGGAVEKAPPTGFGPKTWKV